MKKQTVLLALGLVLSTTPALAQVSDTEIQALRQQIEALTRRLDQLEQQNTELSEALRKGGEQAAAQPAVAQSEADIDEKINQAVAESVDKKMAASSWAERLRWSGDFRYRYETIDQQGKDKRNRSRIRARTAVEADVSPDVQVGFGLATGGDDPVSANQTIGGGGSKKDIKLDLAYFDWRGLENTHVVGGKMKNFLVRPDKTGMMWDGDWRPEGLGVVWDNGRFFAQGLGTWLEGDSSKGTEFSWIVQAGMKLKVGDTGNLKFGAGYQQFDIAGRTPLYGEPDDFYGNSYVVDPVTGALVFANNYRNVEAFAEYKFKLGGNSVSLFGDYTVNTDASKNDTGYLFGAKYGAAKKKGTWDVGYFYEKLEADAVVGLVTDSDFGGGGTDSKGHAFTGTYAFHDNWNFKATYFLNEVALSSGNSKDFRRLMLDLNFKFN